MGWVLESICIVQFIISLCSSLYICIVVAQIKALEAVLAGALRREQVADTTIKELSSEIQQLNTLVCLVCSFCPAFHI
jgi:hypothetical protein